MGSSDEVQYFFSKVELPRCYVQTMMERAYHRNDEGKALNITASPPTI
jgi:hypothetical protein